MLSIIYAILKLVTVVLAFIYLIPCTMALIKKDYYNLKYIKTRILLASILVIISILNAILSIVLQKPGILLVNTMICAIL